MGPEPARRLHTKLDRAMSVLAWEFAFGQDLHDKIACCRA